MISGISSIEKKGHFWQERERIEQEVKELKGVVTGMAGDLRRLRDYVVTQFELRPLNCAPVDQNTQVWQESPPPS